MTSRGYLSFCLLSVLAGCMTPATDRTPSTGPNLTKIEALEAIAALEFSSDSKFLAHVDMSGAVRFWDVFGDKVAVTWSKEKFSTSCVVVGSNNRFAVAAGNRVRIERLEGEKIADVRVDAPVKFMLFDKMASSLAVTDEDGVVSVFDVKTGKSLRTIEPATGDPLLETLPGAGFGVMYLFESGKIQVVSCAPQGPDVTVTFERGKESPVSISADGRFLALLNPEGKVEVRSIPDGTLRAESLSLPWSAASIRLSPDGSVLAVADEDQGVLLWDTAKNEEIDRFKSTVLPELGMVFSHDGNFLAWVESNHRVVRFWSPVKGLVEWSTGQPVLPPDAQKVCRSLADTIRFRVASEPFQRGMKDLLENKNAEALEAFAEVARVLPNYPGLLVAQSQAEERREAQVVRGKLRKAEAAGEYRVALGLLDKFLQDHAKFGNYGFDKDAGKLRSMIQHLDSADEHKSAGRDVEAVIEFEAAVRIVPELENTKQDYVELRNTLLTGLAKEAKTAYAQKDYVRVIKASTSLARLRTLDGEMLMRMGLSHELLGNATLAEKEYEKVDRGSKEFVAARRNIARIARVAGDYTKARAQLETAKDVAELDASLEKDYAEVCQLCKDYDKAVTAWIKVGNLEPGNPIPYSNIATIEEERSRWTQAAAALEEARRRSARPRPKLTVRLAHVLRKAGERKKVVKIYQDLFALIKSAPESVAFMGSTPKITVENWIRELDYVSRRGEWIPREEFLEEQGWENRDGRWLRPREARLREVAQRYQDTTNEKLRVYSEERYQDLAGEKRITKGMKRDEVIKAWGFFSELTVFRTGKEKVVFEQLTFGHSRKVFLRNGYVCYWSE